MLRLNLILNNLVHSIPNVYQGNTLKDPAHRDGKNLKKFDFIVSNPPFKLDFSEFRDDLDVPSNGERFFAGIPSIPKLKKDSMSIFLLFIQHIVFSLSDNGKAAIVVPTGFLSAKDAISIKIRSTLVNSKTLRGIVTMPSNIFATTGTSVSIIFIDKSKKRTEALFVDASNLGSTVKEGRNQKTVLDISEEDLIIETFNDSTQISKFSVLVSYKEIEEYGFSFNPGQFFEMTTDDIQLTPEEFRLTTTKMKNELSLLLKDKLNLEKDLVESIDKLILKNESKQLKK
jgi:type I restriction enzyme M protein